MSLSADEAKLLREAIYVARQGANPTLDTALAQLNEMVLDGSYPFWTNKAVIDSAIGRSPGYAAAWDALLRELKDAPPIGVPNPTPEPTPPDDAYPHPPVDSTGDFEAAVLAVLESRKIFVSDGQLGVGMRPDPAKKSNYQVFIAGEAGATVYFDADQARLDKQHPGTKKQGTVGVSRDGGIRLGQNAEYSEAGSRTVPDPTRPSNIVGCDSLGDWSFNWDGFGYTHKNQSAVFRCRPEGLYIFLPQAQAKLFLEQCASENAVVTSTKEIL